MNRSFKIIGIITIIVIAVLVLINLTKPENTDWRRNFDIAKKSPFGLYVFNQEANDLFNKKLKHAENSPFDYYKNNKQEPHNILIIQTDIDLESWNEILSNVEQGSDAMIIAEDFHPKIADSLAFKTSYINYLGENTIHLTDIKLKSDSIILKDYSTEQGFSSIDKSHQILGNFKYGEGKVNFIKINHGKGHLYLHSEPLFLTNFYLLQKGNEKYAKDIFSYLPDRETIWFSSANKSGKESSQSSLRFIWSKPALKYAAWLFIGGLILFVLFNIKRKQRIIPIEEPLKNKSVEFVKSIGNLYMQEGDFHDMMAKKAQYFLHRVRTELLIDTQNIDENFIHILHLKTGKDLEKIKQAVDFIQRGQDPYSSVMKDDLGKMNRLLDEILSI